MLKIFTKRGYTLVEMVFVIIILGLLASIGVNYLSTAQADKYYAEVCINSLYSPLSERVYSAATSRMLSGDIIPSSYLITNEGKSGFSLKYGSGDIDVLYRKFLLKDVSSCQKGDKYFVSFSSNFSKLKMLPSLSSFGNNNGFEILSGSTTLSTGAFYLKFCSPVTNNPTCYDFGEIVFDARTSMVKKRFCKFYSSGDGNQEQCKEWNIGH